MSLPTDASRRAGRRGGVQDQDDDTLAMFMRQVGYVYALAGLRLWLHFINCSEQLAGVPYPFPMRGMHRVMEINLLCHAANQTIQHVSSPLLSEIQTHSRQRLTLGGESGGNPVTARWLYRSHHPEKNQIKYQEYFALSRFLGLFLAF